MRLVTFGTAIALLAGALTAPALARDSYQVSSLKTQWSVSNQYCRGSNDPVESEAACILRKRISAKLEGFGYCLGNMVNKTGGNDSTWLPCWPPKETRR